MRTVVKFCLLLIAFWVVVNADGTDDDPTPTDDDPTPVNPEPPGPGAFTYPYNACFPSHGSPVAKRESLAIGDTTFICVNINGVITSLFNIRVDEFSAISFQGCKYFDSFHYGLLICLSLQFSNFSKLCTSWRKRVRRKRIGFR